MLIQGMEIDFIVMIQLMIFFEAKISINNGLKVNGINNGLKVNAMKMMKLQLS